MNYTKLKLYDQGLRRVFEFCKANELPEPNVTAVRRVDWHFAPTCAYYRPKDGIRICLELCAFPAAQLQARNWNWPGSVTDREPYGVICHELGHHVDWLLSEQKGSYYGDWSKSVRDESEEPPITSYAPNHAEWFAEIMRLFITNPDLLRRLRPKAYAIIERRLRPCEIRDWVGALGPKPPERIVTNLQKKIGSRK